MSHLMDGSKQRTRDNTGKYILFRSNARLLAKKRKHRVNRSNLDSPT